VPDHDVLPFQPARLVQISRPRDRIITCGAVRMSSRQSRDR
jgi:hypothetical protein